MAKAMMHGTHCDKGRLYTHLDVKVSMQYYDICMYTSLCVLKQVHEGSRSTAHTMDKSKPEVTLLLVSMGTATR